MSRDSIQSAIEAGKRNAAGFELVKNWCEHIRIERTGGRGLVEAETGLPIGHHGLACDHAPRGGMMCWEIRDAAIDFYDRNCKACALRKPLGLPNISQWIGERDAVEAKRRALENEETKARDAAHLTRKAERAAMRPQLSPAAADVLDQIDEIDECRTSENAARLVKTAQLAAHEAFPSEVVDYVFRLLENREFWFAEAGLQALYTLGANSARLAQVAMTALAHRCANHTAGRILIAHASDADTSLIPAALPALLELASPTRDPFYQGRGPRPAPLVRLYACHPQIVTSSLDSALSGRPTEAGRAARGIEILTRRDPAVVNRLSRPLIATFVRARWIPDPDALEHSAEETAANDLRDAIVAAFVQDPQQVDNLLQAFRSGASAAGETRIVSVYSRALHIRRFEKEKKLIDDATRLAFTRILWEATETKNFRTLRDIQSVFGGEPYELIGLAGEEIDRLIGAAILMDGRIIAHDAEVRAKSATMLDSLEHITDRQTLYNLRETFIEWAATGAAVLETPRAYLDLLSNLPEEQESFASGMIEHSVALINSAEDLNVVLPSLYSALVGASVLRRGAALYALSKLPYAQHSNIPDLLYEAFLPTLTDPYIYVHQAAIRVLDHLSLPDRYNSELRNSLWLVLGAHRLKPERHDIVVGCIEQLAPLLTDRQKAGEIGETLVQLIGTIPFWKISQHIRSFARQLARARGIVELLMSSFNTSELTEYGQEHLLDALAGLPNDVLYANRAQLLVIPVDENWLSRQRVLGIIEILSRCGAHSEAVVAADNALLKITDTVREARVRSMFELVKIAAGYESAMATGDFQRVPDIQKQWLDLKSTEES